MLRRFALFRKVRRTDNLPMKNNDKHIHHHLSKFYLKYWANKANKVWVYELNPLDKDQRPNPGLLHVDKVCSVYHLYSIGDDDVSIENWSDKYFETHCAETFKKVNALEEINEDDVLNIKAFLALTMARHPLLKKSSETIVNSFPQRTRRPLNPLAQTLPLRVQANLIEFDKLDLQILYIPSEIDASFLTSDIPFFIEWKLITEAILGENDITDVHKASRAVGDSRTKEEIFGTNEITRPTFNRVWFPISPKTLGFLSENKVSLPYEKITDGSHMININSGLASFAKDILIANEPNIIKSFSKVRKLTV